MDQVVAWLDEPTRRLRQMLCEVPGFAPLAHISLSVHDAAQDMLWAFTVAEADAAVPEVQLVGMAEVPSLVLLADETQPRIVADLAEFGDANRYRPPGARGLAPRSCMTVPIRVDGEFLGFVMFGASVPNFFGTTAQDILETYAEAFGILITRAFDATAIPS
ncbi:GAF domain-containing protein [Paramagnetospirillum kuznetsovii]|uniref:GAF domain-containing protein n=1 Tax=Paramagnetospirillum kuznetsovii TaxID=2053833 RepID=A0A364NUC2_9PROT|nr:GAF domain-containing protein [Paramagnetospirillum kuznetsovii]RAU20678.1 GAF domain-containing protein [Paramagnetospirillum kuznetsovii]